MADDADNAVVDMEVITAAAIEAARRPASAPARTPTGKCHWCDDPVNPGQVFCDEFCLEDHNKRQRAATLAKR